MVRTQSHSAKHKINWVFILMYLNTPYIFKNNENAYLIRFRTLLSKNAL